VPNAKIRNHILAYDIAQPKRLQRVHRLVKSYGTPLQYSVFILQLSRPDLQRLLDELSLLIDPRRDDVRVYPLPSNAQMTQLGDSYTAEGAMLIGGPKVQIWKAQRGNAAAVADLRNKRKKRGKKGRLGG